MVVVIANKLPPAIRGRMKLWFIEAKPNVFVSGIKDSVADTVVEYLFNFCSINSGLLVFQQINKAPYYKIRSLGNAAKDVEQICGLQLLKNK